MNEQLCAFTAKKELWWEGSQYLIEHDNNRYEQIVELFKDKSDITLIHTHPFGNNNLSQIDIESLKGLNFSSGKNILMILISGIESSAYTVWINDVGQTQVTRIPMPAMNKRLNSLCIEAIKRSNYNG